MVREQKKMVILAMLILLVVIIADQVSKSFARESISYGEKIEVSEVVVLTHATNAGFFMNAGDNLQSDYRYWMVSILPFVIIGWIIYRFSSHLLSGRLSAVGIALLLGGGFGNLCDRIITGGVTDFIYIQMGSFISGIYQKVKNIPVKN
ncbi:MAG: hypothetical protein EOO85_23850 [Pedobacter sp.]|nr:MAG: hypothetical protein EOO85_23850 [Pedobacter sp.]